MFHLSKKGRGRSGALVCGLTSTGETAIPAPDELTAATADGNTTGNRDEATTAADAENEAAGASGGVDCAITAGTARSTIAKLAKTETIGLRSLSDSIGARRIGAAHPASAIATPAREHSQSSKLLIASDFVDSWFVDTGVSVHSFAVFGACPKVVAASVLYGTGAPAAGRSAATRNQTSNCQPKAVIIAAAARKYPAHWQLARILCRWQWLEP